MHSDDGPGLPPGCRAGRVERILAAGMRATPAAHVRLLARLAAFLPDAHVCGEYALWLLCARDVWTPACVDLRVAPDAPCVHAPGWHPRIVILLRQMGYAAVDAHSAHAASGLYAHGHAALPEVRLLLAPVGAWLEACPLSVHCVCIGLAEAADTALRPTVPFYGAAGALADVQARTCRALPGAPARELVARGYAIYGWAPADAARRQSH